jgi:hypothetical protein
MALSQIEQPAVEAALAEFDKLGRQDFLHKYGFGVATKYLLRNEGRFYDPKAIVGAAHQHTAGGSPLKPSEFDATTAIARLEHRRPLCASRAPGGHPLGRRSHHRRRGARRRRGSRGRGRPRRMPAGTGRADR